MNEIKKSTRTAFAEALLEMGNKNENIVTVAADSASRFGDFVKKFPGRSFNVGIAEQTMVSVAAGLAQSGKIPVTAAYANFLAFRAIEQVRVDIAGSGQNVKLIGTDTGFSSGWLGFTHIALEDIAAMRAVPGIVIIDPSDAEEAYKATKEILDYEGPVYMRLRGRKEEPLLNIPEKDFKIGRGQVLAEGGDVLIIACGNAVYNSIKAAELMKSKGINPTVINMSTIRPLDEELIAKYASSIKNIVTVEHHNVTGGLGSAVAEFLSENMNCIRLKRLGGGNCFGEAGDIEMLIKEFGLDGAGIAASVERFLQNN